MSDDILKKLYDVLEQRKTADPETSYVAGLYAKGPEKIGEKIGEEAVETIIEAVKGDKEKLKAESADLLFHLMVLWADQGIKPGDVLDILENRFGVGGLEEKASRTEP